MSSAHNDLIANAVLETWIATGEPSTVATVAEVTGLSEGAVRRALAAAHGAVPGTRCTDAYVQVLICKGYPGMGTRDRKVAGLVPDMDRVRALIRSLRAAQ